MANNQKCLRCGTAMVVATSRGYCPTCLFRDGLAEQSGPKTEDGAPNAEGGSPRRDVITPPLSLPTRFGDYELLEVIARGGMGIVYKARQMSLDRIVALKMLLFGQQASPEFVQRFHAEAGAAACLQHPNIVAIHEVGVHEGQHFFVMDYVAGPSLAQRISDMRFRISDFEQSARWLKTIAEAVHYAHERGILHRDLKPSNVMLDAVDEPHVVDFGLAKRFEGDSQVTFTGQVLGSPNYIPPEQALGKRGKVSRQSDVYALGAMLYHLSTGRPPFQAETVPETLQQVLNTEPLAPRLLNPSVPRDLETISLKCLEKEVSRRYATAQELADELARFLGGQPIFARPVGPVGKGWKWCRRRPALAGMGAALGLTVVLGMTGVLWQWRRATVGESLAQQNAQAELRQRYAADMHLAQLALDQNNRPLASSLLDTYWSRHESQIANRKSQIPGDLRGWEWRYLWRRCQGDESFTLHRYARAVNALAVSKEGEFLAVTSEGIALWDLKTRRPIAESPPGTTKALAFCPTGHYLAFGCRNPAGQPEVALWDLSAGKVAKAFQQEADVGSLTFSLNGRLLAALDNRGNITVFEWKSDRTLTNLTIRPSRYGRAGVVAFSPDGSQLAVGQDLGKTSLIDLHTGARQFLQTQLGVGVTALAFSPAGDRLAAGYGYGKGTIRLWDPRTGHSLGQMANHTSDVTGLAFTSDGRHLASASDDGTIRLWNVEDLGECLCLRSSHERLTALAMLPDGRTLISGGTSGSVCFWDLSVTNRNPGSLLMRVSSGLESMAEVDAPGYAGGRLDPRVVRRCGGVFTPDSRQFVALDCAGALALWDAYPAGLVEKLTAFGSNHWGVALAPDGRWLVTGDTSGTVTVWDWRAQGVVTNFTLPFEWFGLLRFRCGGRYLLAGAVHNDLTLSVKLWRTARWEEVPLTGRQFAGLWSLDLASDERLLAAGYADGTLKLFLYPSGDLQTILLGNRGPVNSVHFLPGNRELVSTSMDGSARLWEVRTGQELAVLHGHPGLILGGTLSPDGRRLATGGRSPSDTVKLWDLAAQRELLTLQGEGLFFFDLGFSLDGNTLMATGLSGETHLWHAPSLKDIEAAKKGKVAP